MLKANRVQPIGVINESKEPLKLCSEKSLNYKMKLSKYILIIINNTNTDGNRHEMLFFFVGANVTWFNVF